MGNLRLTPARVIIAGLLHDVVEDTSASSKDIEERFGEDVASLVEAVTKPMQRLEAGVSVQFARRRQGGSACYNGPVMGFLRFLLLPVLFLIASIYVLRLAMADGSFILYFVAAVLLGMGIAAYLRAWKRPPDE